MAALSLAALATGTAAPLAQAAPTVTSVAATPRAGKCFGKSPTIVLTGKGQKRVLTKTTKNAVVDLLGKGETFNAGKAKGNTLVCDTGGAKSITTGDGNDKVSVKDGSPTVSTGKGNDTVTESGTGNPVIHLGAGVDSATLGKGNGTVYGDDGNDTLRVGSKGKQKLFGGSGHDTLVAGAATSTLDGQAGGTAYLVAGAYSGRTTVVLHPGDTVNGKAPVSPTPAPVTPQPVTPVAPVAPVAPLPVGTVIAFGNAAVANVTPVAKTVDFALTGAPGSGRTLAGWALDFGDGSPVHRGVGVPPSSIPHAYYAVGTFTATLSLTDDLAHTVNSQATVDVSGADAADLSITSATGTPANQSSKTVAVAVKNTPGQRATIIMSTVDFGDGSFPTTTGGPAATTLSHTYSAAGSYYIDLTETDDHGGYVASYKKVNIVDGAVHATLLGDNGFPLSQVLGAAGSYTEIDASRSVGIGTGAFTALSVDPGDGSGVENLLTDPFTNIHYKAGSYTAKLTATSGGSTVSSSYPVYVAAPSSGTVVGPSNPATAVAGAPITFTTTTTLGAAPSGGPANKAVTQVVDFGDGTDKAGLSGNTIAHTYSTPGVYTVFFELTDAYGGPQSAQGLEVTVTRSTPYLSFTANESYPDGSPWVGTSVSPDASSPETYGDFSGLGSTGHQAGATYRVDWGDGTTPDSGTANSDGYIDPFAFRHAYLKAGEFTATASVTDSANLTTTVTQHVSVAGTPTLTLGTPTVANGILTQPVTSSSPGAGAAPDTYSVFVEDAAGNVFQATGNGAPGTLTIAVPGGTAPYEVDVSYSSDHGVAGAEAKTS